MSAILEAKNPAWFSAWKRAVAAEEKMERNKDLETAFKLFDAIRALNDAAKPELGSDFHKDMESWIKDIEDEAMKLTDKTVAGQASRLVMQVNMVRDKIHRALLDEEGEGGDYAPGAENESKLKLVDRLLSEAMYANLPCKCGHGSASHRLTRQCKSYPWGVAECGKCDCKSFEKDEQAVAPKEKPKTEAKNVCSCGHPFDYHRQPPDFGCQEEKNGCPCVGYDNGDDLGEGTSLYRQVRALQRAGRGLRGKEEAVVYADAGAFTSPKPKADAEEKERWAARWLELYRSKGGVTEDCESSASDEKIIDGSQMPHPTFDENGDELLNLTGWEKGVEEAFVVDPSGIAASLDAAGKSTADRTKRIAAEMDALPEGYQIKSSRTVWTKQTIGGDVFWHNGRGKYLPSSAALKEIGRPLEKHVKGYWESFSNLLDLCRTCEHPELLHFDIHCDVKDCKCQRFVEAVTRPPAGLQAAFIAPDGKFFATGPIHDFSRVPDEAVKKYGDNLLTDWDTGFVADGHFINREEAAILWGARDALDLHYKEDAPKHLHKKFDQPGNTFTGKNVCWRCGTHLPQGVPGHPRICPHCWTPAFESKGADVNEDALPDDPGYTGGDSKPFKRSLPGKGAATDKCPCGHTRGQHRTTTGCDECDCKEYDGPGARKFKAEEWERVLKAALTEWASDEMCPCGHDIRDHFHGGPCKACGGICKKYGEGYNFLKLSAGPAQAGEAKGDRYTTCPECDANFVNVSDGKLPFHKFLDKPCPGGDFKRCHGCGKPMGSNSFAQHCRNCQVCPNCNKGESLVRSLLGEMPAPNKTKAAVKAELLKKYPEEVVNKALGRLERWMRAAWGRTDYDSGEMGFDGALSNAGIYADEITKEIGAGGTTGGTATQNRQQFGIYRNRNWRRGEAVELNEALTDADAQTIKAGINAPHVNASLSTLGGADRASVMISFSLDPKETWINGIFENSRYARFHYESNGVLEMFSGSGPRGKRWPTFRKTRAASAQEVVTKINAWIAKVSGMTEEAVRLKEGSCDSCKDGMACGCHKSSGYSNKIGDYNGCCKCNGCDGTCCWDNEIEKARAKETPKNEGKVVTPKYAAYVSYGPNAKFASTPFAWTREYGRPTTDNIAKYVQKFIDSQKPGGANAHITGHFGTPMIPVALTIKDQFSGATVATWSNTGESFEQTIHGALKEDAPLARWSSRSGKHWVELHKYTGTTIANKLDPDTDGGKPFTGYSYKSPGASGNMGTFSTDDEAIKALEKKIGTGYFQPDKNKLPMQRESYVREGICRECGAMVWPQSGGICRECGATYPGECGEAFDRFDTAEGYYWWLADHHEGQWSDKYARLSKLSKSFKPGAAANGPSTEGAKEVYRELCRKYACTHDPFDDIGPYKESFERTIKGALKEWMHPFGSGSTQVWYTKPEWFTRMAMGNASPDPKNLSKTHVLLGTVTDTNPERIYSMLQGENWSPEGEAREFISGKGLSHTSMSMGDVIVLPGGRAVVVDDVGFRSLGMGEAVRACAGCGQKKTMPRGGVRCASCRKDLFKDMEKRAPWTKMEGWETDMAGLHPYFRKKCVSCGKEADLTTKAGAGDPLCVECWKRIKAEKSKSVKEWEEDDYPTCPMCGGPGVPLGKMGRLEHYRCRNCGMDFNREIEEGFERTITSALSEENLKYHDCGDAGEEVFDAQGLYLCKVCPKCKKAKLAGYRPEILTGYDQNDVDEPIEPED